MIDDRNREDWIVDVYFFFTKDTRRSRATHNTIHVQQKYNNIALYQIDM